MMLFCEADQPNLQEFYIICQHDSCSDFILDLLMFIKDKMLRMSPRKRASCQEIVGKFTELYKRCSSDPDYCTKRENDPPQRSGTDLSELAASALDLSPAMYNRIPFKILPEHTGPVENDSQLSRSPDAQSLALDLGVTSLTDSALAAKAEPGRKGKAPENVNTFSEHPTSTSTTFGDLLHSPNIKRPAIAPLDPSKNDETNSSQPLSPSKKVHFEKKEQQFPESSVSGNEYRVGILRAQPGQKEEQSKIDQKREDQVYTHSAIMGSELTGIRAVPSTSSAFPGIEPAESLSDSMKRPESISAPEHTESTVRTIDSATINKVSTAKDSVAIGSVHTVPPVNLKSSNLQTRKSSDADGEGSTVGTAPAAFEQDQIQGQNNLPTEESNVGGNHSRDEGPRNKPPPNNFTRSVKQFLSSLCCCFASGRVSRAPVRLESNSDSDLDPLVPG
jgi:hypothetical protein